MNVVNFFVKSVSFDVFQLIIFNCEISMRILFYEFCKELKVFKNNKEMFNYLTEIVSKDDFNDKNNEILKYFKLSNYKLKLSNDELIKIIKSFKSVNYYELFDFLFDFIELLNDEIAKDLLDFILENLQITNNKKQQQIQLKIIKKLMKYQTVKDYLINNFVFVVCTLNIQLVDFVFNELYIDVNELFNGYNVLQWVVIDLVNNSNENNDFAYEMFEYLLTIGADINKRGENDINKITDLNIRQNLIIRLFKFRKNI